MKTRMSGGQRRDAIIAASIRLFAEQGFHGATTRELARAVGVTEPVLYRHFRTKSELYRAIIRQKAREGEAAIERRLDPYVNGADDAGFFSTLAAALLDRYERDASYVRLLLFSALERHELASLFYEQRTRALYRLVAEYLKRRMNEGAVRQMDARLAAHLFFGMVNHHGLMQVLFQKSPVGMNRVVMIRHLVQFFLRGLAAVPGGESPRPRV